MTLPDASAFTPPGKMDLVRQLFRGIAAMTPYASVRDAGLSHGCEFVSRRLDPCARPVHKPSHAPPAGFLQSPEPAEKFQQIIPQ